MQAQQDSSTQPLAKSSQTPSGSGWSMRPRPTRKGAANLLVILGLLGVPSVAQATDMLPLPPELGTWGVAAYALIEVVREIGRWFHSDREAKAKEQENIALREALKRSDDALAALKTQREQEQAQLVRELHEKISALSGDEPRKRSRFSMRAVSSNANT